MILRTGYGPTQYHEPHIAHRRQNIKTFMHFGFQKLKWNCFIWISKTFLKYQAKLRIVRDLIDLNRFNTSSTRSLLCTVHLARHIITSVSAISLSGRTDLLKFQFCIAAATEDSTMRRIGATHQSNCNLRDDTYSFGGRIAQLAW